MSIQGVLLVHKPVGPSSAHLARQVGKVLRASRVGHAGTLDPFASGLLPVCLGEATKISNYLMAEDRSYRATIRFGFETDTDDCTGQIVSEGKTFKEISQDELRKVLDRFLGVQEQVPPQFSAKKVKGERSYDRARKGMTTHLRSQTIRIDRIDLSDLSGDLAVVDIDCSKGTYIRSIARDLGRVLGCGAHLAALVRTRHGDLCLSNALTPEVIASRSEAEDLKVGQDLGFLTMDQALAHLPSVDLVHREVGEVLQGKPLLGLNLASRLNNSPQGGEEIVKLVDQDRNLIALISHTRADNPKMTYLRVFPPETAFTVNGPAC